MIANILISGLMIDSFQQWRLIPKLAATYALAYFARTFFMNFVELQVGLMMGATAEEQVSLMIWFLLPASDSSVSKLNNRKIMF